ncbi:hypothetical protein GO730_29630 [Spirosoma sp. HMF3257]|uniref:Uncharacterized protein n=1 Tax=Spirosoma telluris TaxID=2183553 RepID=A0A327NS60_9BACT|nr:hypothetical protein [Spirosoma telluris]RAI77289.1 hypothetical protein HMF3257_29535 [Spirosoma telluris]
MVISREVHFDGTCPSINEVVKQVRRRTGIPASYVADKWLLTNPLNKVDMFSLYQEGDHTIVVTNDEPATDLLGATLHTLVEMGGFYRDGTA